MGIGNPVHLAFIAIVALIVLGPKRLPELAKSLGHGYREFMAALNAAANGENEEQEPEALEAPAVVHPSVVTPIQANGAAAQPGQETPAAPSEESSAA